VARPTESVTLNAGYGRGYSVLEVLDAVDRVTNMKLDRRIESRRAGDPPALVSDNRAILDTLDWHPQRADLDIIVADALAWERKLAERA
jgi:UDP-glucose 4-epimerase